MNLIDEYLYGVVQADPETKETLDKSANRSTLNLHTESSTDTENEESKDFKTMACSYGIKKIIVTYFLASRRDP